MKVHTAELRDFGYFEPGFGQALQVGPVPQDAELLTLVLGVGRGKGRAADVIEHFGDCVDRREWDGVLFGAAVS